MVESANTYVAVIDDDASVCRALARLLRESGMHVVTYARGEEFLGDQKRPRFDCVLLDLQLATVSGIDFQRQLAERGEVAPVIFITANDDPQSREQALRGGCVAYFRKTAPGEEILAAIRKAVAPKEGAL